MIFPKTKWFRSIFFTLIYFSGLPYLIRVFLQRNKCTIILYHDIEADIFETHLCALKQRYNIISLQDFLKAGLNKNQKLPKNSLVITLDDGNKGNYNLLPVIKKYKVPVTIFLCSSIINSNRHFWFKHGIDYEFEELRSLNAGDMELYLKKHGYDIMMEYEIRQALNKEEIESMKSFIDFQSHTKSHVFLPACCHSRANDEIYGSYNDLKNNYGLKINALSYPNGDYTEREIDMAKQAGYESGITVDLGFNSIKQDPFKLKRICISDDASINELLVQAAGISKFVKTILRKRDSCFIFKNYKDNFEYNNLN